MGGRSAAIERNTNLAAAFMGVDSGRNLDLSDWTDLVEDPGLWGGAPPNAAIVAPASALAVRGPAGDQWLQFEHDDFLVTARVTGYGQAQAAGAFKRGLRLSFVWPKGPSFAFANAVSNLGLMFFDTSGQNTRGVGWDLGNRSIKTDTALVRSIGWQVTAGAADELWGVWTAASGFWGYGHPVVDLFLGLERDAGTTYTAYSVPWGAGIAPDEFQSPNTFAGAAGAGIIAVACQSTTTTDAIQAAIRSPLIDYTTTGWPWEL